jgi:hypothetical protein
VGGERFVDQLLIRAYFNEIDRLKRFSGTTTEGVISEAFKDLLKAWAQRETLIFLSQFEFLSPQRNRNGRNRRGDAKGGKMIAASLRTAVYHILCFLPF